MKKFLAGFACLIIAGSTLEAQSVYSFEGLGSLEHQGMPNNVGAGEVGIGSPTIWHVNTLNPANLVYNSFSTFQLGLELDQRRFTGDGISGNDTKGALRFLAYAFPIMPGKWSSSFGILPYSSVNYNTFSEGPVDGNADVTQISDNRGEGGLTNFYWANGFRVAGSLFLGVRANYTFGSIDKSSIITIGGEDVSLSTISYEDKESYSDINLQFGAGYRYSFNENQYLNLGATFSPQSNFNGTSELSLNRLTGTGREIESQTVSTTKIARDLPQSIGLGISYQKLNNLTIGLDWELQQWEDVAQSDESFTNFSKIAIGVDWIPDYDDINSYFQRARYSFGLNRVTLPYIVNNQTLTDFGINFGASLPVSGFSSVDVAAKMGRLGESGNGLIRENYFKIVIGATINDRWFIKRRYD